MQKIITVTELNNKLFYKYGDTINVSGTVAGYFTTSGTALGFLIPVEKYLSNINSARITFAKMVVRQNGSYCVGNASNYEVLNLNTDHPRATILRESGSLSIGFTFPRTRAAVNNDTCAVSYEMTIQFS